MKPRILTACILFFLFLILCVQNAYPEISVVLDGKGKYVTTLLLANENNGQTYFWEPVRKGVPLYMMLNIEGDLCGDGKPSIAENPLNGWPWAVWQHFNGRNNDILFSYWDGITWTAPAFVVSGASNDIEPCLAFDPSGTPYVAFTQRSGISRVFCTAFLNGVWTKPSLVSDPAIDSSKPGLLFERDFAVIAFLTKDGVKIIPLEEIAYHTRDIEEGPNPLPEYNANGGSSGIGGNGARKGK